MFALCISCFESCFRGSTKSNKVSHSCMDVGVNFVIDLSG